MAIQVNALAQEAALTGIWEGPWYRGMTSGKVKIDLREQPGTIQFTNLDNFGTQPSPVQASLDSGVLKRGDILVSDFEKIILDGPVRIM